MSPEIAFVTEIRAEVAPILSLGAGVNGERRIVPITGGRCAGPRLNGEVLPGGADFQHIRPDGVLELEARYALRLDDGALVNVVNQGLRHAAPEDMARLARGEPVPPERIYFRTTPRFDTSAPAHAWITRTLFLGLAERHPDHVRIRVFAF
jgi:hypothetical protein